MRGARAQIACLLVGFFVSGCMQTSSPVAMGPRNDLDSMAYGTAYARPAYPTQAAADSGGAISALRASLAASPRETYAAATPAAYAAAPAPHDAPYRLDAGDKLRVVVYGQEGLTNTYAIDAGGAITMPLIGAVAARGKTPAGLAAEISAKLRNGYIREPSVAVEVETYRPFFILGEVTTPGQYPYVADMTVEKAIAIAGGFSPRAFKTTVELTRSAPGERFKGDVPLNYPLRPGDTVLVKERWF
jgi:polysaccharide biosynthesis/export protein